MRFLLLLLATAFFVLGNDQAEAAPVFAAIGAIAAAITKLGIIGKLIIGVALSVGQSLLAKAMAKKNETKQATGVDLSVSMGDDVPLSFTVGTYATGGKRKYIGTWGSDGDTPNAYLVDVIELENIPSAGLSGLWAGDTKCTILWNAPHPGGLGFPVQEYRRGGKDYLWVKFADGSQTVADAYLRAKFGSNAERLFSSDMIGLGCSYVVLTCRYNSDVFSGGLPDWAFEMTPRKFYDLRKDSTNGGNGPQRWTEPSTWGSTSNVAIIAYNIIRGISYGDEWVYGGQNVAAFRLPASNWIAGANECDAAIELTGGATELAFRCGFEINVDREPLAVLEELQKAANMRIAEVGGVFKILVGAPGAAVYSFTDDDVIVTEGQNLAPFPSFDATFNGIEATYPEPSEKWASKDAPARYDADLEAEDDNNRLPAGVDFAAVPFGNQVQRLMVAMIQDYRRFRVHQFHLPPDAYPLEPNDVVSWSSGQNGYNEKKFLVTAITGQRTFNRLASLKEIDPSDYDWSSDRQLPVVTGWIGKISLPVQVIAGWQVEPAIIENAAGTSQRPSIKVSCAPDRDGVTHVWVKVRLAADKSIVFDSDAIRYAEPFSWKLNGTFTPKTDYEVSGEFISDVNPNQQRSEWLPVTTPNALISTFDVFDNAITATKIADAAVSADKLMNEAVTSLKLADQAVSTAKLQVEAVTAEILANNAVTASKLAEGAISATKFAAGIEPVSIVTSGALPAVKTTTNITWQGQLYTWDGSKYTKPAPEVSDGSITSTKIADNSITTPKLVALAITSDKIAANSIVAGKIAAGAVSAAQIAAGAITTEKLAVGLGKNWLSNSDFSAGLQGWGTEYVNYPAGSTITMRQDQYGVRPYGSIQLRYLGSQTDAVLGVQPVLPDGSQKLFSCVPGQWLEMSGRYLGHRTAAFKCWIEFVNASGSTLSYANLLVLPSNQNTDPNYTLANYQPFFGKVQVPAGAVQCRPFWRFEGIISGSPDSYLWLKNLFFGLATANQTEATQWSDGGITVIGPGNIATGSVLADKIGALAVTAGKIAANAVTATEIAANAITAAKIMAGSVTGDKLVANTITARELILTDFTNLIPNGDFASGNFASTWTTYPSATGDNVGFLEGGGWQLNGNRALLIQKSTATTSAHDCFVETPSFIPIEGGASYAVETSVWSNTGSTPSGFFVVVNYYDVNKAYLSSAYPISNAPVSSSRANYKNKFPTRSDARFAKVAVYNNAGNVTTDNFIVDYVYLRKANAASLIVDGSITAAQIKANSITADKMNVTSLAAISANLGNVNIENAIIGDLQVGTSNIAPGAVSSISQGNATGAGVIDITVSHGTGSPNIIVFFSATGSGNNANSGTAQFDAVSLTDNSTILGSVSLSNNAQAPMGKMSTSSFAFFQPPAGRASTTFRFYTFINTAISTSSISTRMLIMTQKR